MHTPPNRELAGGIAFVLLIGACGLALGTQGWRSQNPDADVISYIRSAHDLLTHGRIPDRGTITSFGSYATPGLSWLFLPGVALFSDPRLFGFVGSGLLHIGTLLGIFLLARRYLSLPYALLSVALYGFSEIGLYFAGALWPRGQPSFYVWTVFCTCLWAESGKAKYLATALITLAAGVYVFMEVAPALLILPAVWFFYRPKIDGRAIALAGVVAIVIWYPYLSFETRRGFADLRSQILLQDMRSTNAKTWCDPTLPLLHNQAGMANSTTERGARSWPVRFILAAGRRVLAVAGGLVNNFEGVIPGIRFIMMALALAGLWLLSLHTNRFRPLRLKFASNRTLTMLGVGLIILGIVANEVLIGRYIAPFTPNKTLVPETVSTIRTLQILAALGGIAILMRRSISKTFTSLTTRFRPRNPDTLALGLSLAVPWLFLLLVAEHGRNARFFWLLPVQVIVIAACLTTLPRRFGPVVGGLLLACSLFTTPLVSAVVSARHDGWSGQDSPEVQVVDFVSDRIRSSGRNQASIGYVGGEEDITKFTQIYRIGAEFDLFFNDLHQVSNTNTCPEGIAPDNQYRIGGTEAENAPFETTVKGFHFLKQFGGFSVYQRD